MMTTQPETVGAAVVTPNQMLDKIDHIGKSVDHLASIVDPALTDIRSDVGDHEHRIRALEEAGVGDHEHRIRTLERAMWKVAGAAGGIAAAGGFGLAKLAEYLA